MQPYAIPIDPYWQSQRLENKTTGSSNENHASTAATFISVKLSFSAIISYFFGKNGSHGRSFPAEMQIITAVTAVTAVPIKLMSSPE